MRDSPSHTALQTFALLSFVSGVLSRLRPFSLFCLASVLLDFGGFADVFCFRNASRRRGRRSSVTYAQCLHFFSLVIGHISASFGSCGAAFSSFLKCVQGASGAENSSSEWRFLSFDSYRVNQTPRVSCLAYCISRMGG